MSAWKGRCGPQGRSQNNGAAQRRTGVTPSRGEGDGGRASPSALHGRPQGRSQNNGAAQRRTGVTPSRGEGDGGRACP